MLQVTDFIKKKKQRNLQLIIHKKNLLIIALKYAILINKRK